MPNFRAAPHTGKPFHEEPVEIPRTFDVMVFLKTGKSFVNIYPMKESAVSNMQHILANTGRIDVQTGEDQLTTFHTSSVDYLVITEILEEKTS